jgi:hypothetical protein
MNTPAGSGRNHHAPGTARSGDVVDRRGFLRVAAGLSLVLPAALAGCGEVLTFAAPPLHYAIELPSIPTAGFPTLITERARALRVEILFNDSADPTTVRQATVSSPFINPVNDKYPLENSLVVVEADLQSGTPDPEAFDVVAQSYIRRGGKLVSYLTPLAHQTAQISVSPSELGALLATDAAAWARARPDTRASALYFPPPPGSSVAPAVEQAIRATLARLEPSVTLTTISDMRQAISALRSNPGPRIVLCAVDADALALAQMLRSPPRPAIRGSLYVGGLGSPTTFAEVLTELRRDAVLRAIVAARPRDLAYALVDLPVALLRHQAPSDVQVPPRLLKPRSPALSAFMHDYAIPASSQTGSYLNPLSSALVTRTTQ